MENHMTAPLSELKTQVLEDGIIDAEEVAQLKERLYADGIIDREEAEFLFELNDAVSGKANDPSWQTLFVEAIAAHVLEDEESPGESSDDRGPGRTRWSSQRETLSTVPKMGAGWCCCVDYRECDGRRQAPGTSG